LELFCYLAKREDAQGYDRKESAQYEKYGNSLCHFATEKSCFKFHVIIPGSVL